MQAKFVSHWNDLRSVIFVLSVRFWGHQRGSRFGRWTLTIQSLSSHRSKHTLGQRCVHVAHSDGCVTNLENTVLAFWIFCHKIYWCWSFYVAAILFSNLNGGEQQQLHASTSAFHSAELKNEAADKDKTVSVSSVLWTVLLHHKSLLGFCILQNQNFRLHVRNIQNLQLFCFLFPPVFLFLPKSHGKFSKFTLGEEAANKAATVEHLSKCCI